MSEPIKLQFDNTVTGDEKVHRLAETMDKFLDAGERAGKRTAEAFARVPVYLQAAESAASRAAKTISEVAIGAYALKSAIVSVSGALATTATSTDTVVNSVRVLRFALSPTIFTGATIAVGLLAEKTLGLVNARGKLIEQQSLLAASRGLEFADVERIGLAAKIRGGSSDTALAALSSLRGNIGSSKTQGILSELGVADYARGSASPELLSQIARGLSSLEDPARRARVAIDLFGEELAGRVLPELNTRFEASTSAVEDWALSLDRGTRNQVYVMRRDMTALKEDLLSLGIGFQAFGQKVEQSLVVAAAKSYDFFSTWDARSAYVPGVGVVDPAKVNRSPDVSDGEVSQILKYSLGRQRGKADAATQDAVAASLGRDASGTISHLLSGKEGLEATLSGARSRQSAALLALEGDRVGPNAGELSATQRRDFAASLVASGQEITRAEDALKVIADAAEAKAKAIAQRLGEPEKIRSMDLAARMANTESPIARAAYQAEDELRGVPSGSSLPFWRSVVGKTTLEFQSAAQKAQQEWSQKFIDEGGIPNLRQVKDFRFVDDIASQVKGGENLDAAAERNRASMNADDRESFAGVRSTADHFSRMSTLRARPGEETAALREALVLRNDALGIEQAIIALGGDRYDQTRELARIDRERQDAAWKFEESIQELRNKNLASFRDNVVRGFDDLVSGRGGNILKSFGLGLERQIIGNVAMEIYPMIQKATSGLHIAQGGTVSRLLAGTPFGPDPLKGSASALDLAALKLSAAGDKLLGAGVGGPGGGTGSTFSSVAGLLFGKTGGASGSLYQYGDIGLEQTTDGVYDLPNRGMSNAGVIANSPGLKNRFTLGKGVGMATAAAAGGFAAYDQFSHGGARGIIGGAGALAGTASALIALSGATGPAAPILAGVGLALGMVTSLFGDPKKNRAEEISMALEKSVYHAPTAIDATMDTSGRFVDSDSRGNLRRSEFRGIPQVRDPYTRWEAGQPYEAPGSETSPYQAPVVIQHIYQAGAIQTLDSESFHDYAQRNAAAIGEAAGTFLQDRAGNSRLSDMVQEIAGR